MLKILFNDEELNVFLKKIYFQPRQKQIIMYRREDLSRQQMADSLKCSVSTIDKEIDKICKIIKNAYDRGIIQIDEEMITLKK